VRNLIDGADRPKECDLKPAGLPERSIVDSEIVHT
jgi:hypothetical protein